MTLELAKLSVRDGEGKAFEAAFAEAQGIISAMPGYVGHELQRCLEFSDRYVLLVRWRSVEDHEVGFRPSRWYPEWKRLMHHFF